MKIICYWIGWRREWVAYFDSAPLIRESGNTRADALFRLLTKEGKNNGIEVVFEGPTVDPPVGDQFDNN